MDDEYYYEDEDEYEEGELGETEQLQIALENTYAEGKALIASDPVAAAAKLKEVLAEDAGKGLWTFKALKMLHRAALRAQDYPAMVDYFQRALQVTSSDVQPVMLQKASTKMIDQAARVPAEYQDQMVNFALKISEKDLNVHGRQWFTLKLRRAQALFAEDKRDDAIQEIAEAKKWCTTGDGAAQRNSTLLLSGYALEMEIEYTRMNLARVQELSGEAAALENIIFSPRPIGVINFFSAIVAAWHGDMPMAYDLFVCAFRSLNDSGDPFRYRALRCLIFSSMLFCSAESTQLLITHETKAHSAHPEVAAIVQLWTAFNAGDVQTFLAITRDAANASVLDGDSFVKAYLDIAIYELRLRAVEKYAKPYHRVCIARLAKRLVLSDSESVLLCARGIADGRLQATINQVDGVLSIRRSTDGGADMSETFSAADFANRSLESQSAGVSGAAIGASTAGGAAQAGGSGGAGVEGVSSLLASDADAMDAGALADAERYRALQFWSEATLTLQERQHQSRRRPAI